jgi:hypothetical protein
MNTPQEQPRQGTCGGKTRNGNPCKLPAGHGTSHPGYGNCDHHTGATPNGIAHARQLQAVDAAQRFGVPVETTATDALIKLLHDAAGDVAFYRARVAALPQDAMVYGSERITRRRNGEVVEDTTVAKSRKNEWVAQLQDAQRHFLEVAATIAKLGIEVRRMELADEQMELFYSTFMRAVALLGVSDDDRVADVLVQVMGEIVGPAGDGGDGELYRTAAPGDSPRCPLPLQVRGSAAARGAGSGC